MPGFLIFSTGSLFAVLTGASFSIGRFFLGYSIFLAAQIAVQYSNDYFDYEADLRNTRTAFSGGSGVLAKNPELKIAARWIAVFLLVASIILTLLFILIFDYSFILMGIVILTDLVVWFYTAPPIRMAYRGLGESAIIFNTGFILPLMGFYILKGGFTKEIFIFTVPFMIYGLNFALSVELPDYEADIVAGKKNIISSFGRTKGYILILVFSVIGSSIFFLISYFFNLGGGPIDFKLIGLASLLLIPVSLAGVLLKNSYFVNGGEKRKASIIIKYYLLTLMVLLLFLNIYFLYLLCG